jgi:hypothetical protein
MLCLRVEVVSSPDAVMLLDGTAVVNVDYGDKVSPSQPGADSGGSHCTTSNPRSKGDNHLSISNKPRQTVSYGQRSESVDYKET